MCSWELNKEIQIFQEYLRIPTVHPNVDYTACIEFLKRQAGNLDLPFDIVHPAVECKPVLIMKWLGKEPHLPAIMLNSHMDVVPVFADKWTHPPFSAHIDAEGRIYARGTQDMKSVGMQYLAAIRALKAIGYQPKRTIYVTFVPDEEIGGKLGMKSFVEMDYFKQLNIGFALDEGSASVNDVYPIYYAERVLWHINLKFSGPAGHGSLLLRQTAAEKLHYLTKKLMEFRAREVARLDSDKNLDLGEVTTVNLTKLSGGIQTNVIPAEMEATFDIRFALDVDIAAFEKQLEQWCTEAGGGIVIEFLVKNPCLGATKVDDTNPYWTAFKSVIDELGLKIATRVIPGATDVRYLRGKGIPALGFSPMANTPILLHDHDEWLRADTYLRGIEIYTKLITALAGVSNK